MIIVPGKVHRFSTIAFLSLVYHLYLKGIKIRSKEQNLKKNDT